MKNILKFVLFILVVIVIIVIGLLYFKQQGNSTNTVATEKYKALEDLREEDSDLNLSSFIENKYYIVMQDNIVYHKEELNKFIENVNLNIPDKIRIVQADYGNNKFELKDIEFTKDKFIVKTDNRWDGNLPTEDRKIITNEYEVNNYSLVKEPKYSDNTHLSTFYEINLAGNNNLSSIYLCDYLDIKPTNQTNFELEFNKDLTKGREIILLKSETTKYNYDVYSYNGTVNIIIDGEKLTLRDALLNNRITIEQIIEKANKDANEYKTICKNTYLDGGSQEYFYNDYVILKFNSIEQIPQNQQHTSYNTDLYIGNPAMDMNELKKLYYNAQ